MHVFGGDLGHAAHQASHLATRQQPAGAMDPGAIRGRPPPPGASRPSLGLGWAASCGLHGSLIRGPAEGLGTALVAQHLSAPTLVATAGSSRREDLPPQPKSKEDYKIHSAAVDRNEESCTFGRHFVDSMGDTVFDSPLGEEGASGTRGRVETGDARAIAALDWAWHGRGPEREAEVPQQPSESAP